MLISHVGLSFFRYHRNFVWKKQSEVIRFELFHGLWLPCKIVWLMIKENRQGVVGEIRFCITYTIKIELEMFIEKQFPIEPIIYATWLIRGSTYFYFKKLFDMKVINLRGGSPKYQRWNDLFFLSFCWEQVDFSELPQIAACHCLCLYDSSFIFANKKKSVKRVETIYVRIEYGMASSCVNITIIVFDFFHFHPI